MLNFIDREFNYQGVLVEGCFGYCRELPDIGAWLYVRIYDDAYITAHRVFKDGSRTNEYLISSVSQLLSAILDDGEWESYATQNTHEGLSPIQVRRLYLNAPNRIKKQLRSHPSYADIVKQLEKSLVNPQQQIRQQVLRQVKEAQALISTDPYLATSNLYRLAEKYPDLSSDIDSVLEDALHARNEWDKLLSAAKQRGKDRSKLDYDAETFARVARALHWNETQQATHRVPTPSHLLSCEGASYLPNVLTRRIATLSEKYPDVDKEVLREIVLICDKQSYYIDLSKPLSEQFEF